MTTPLILLDPGHGGTDPGATHEGIHEADVVLDIARRVQSYLNTTWFVSAQLTRDSNTTTPLAARADTANRANADGFVSLHLNSHDTASANGFETFVHPNAGKGTRNLQSTLHNAVVEQLLARGMRNRGMKQQDFAVLRMTRCPAVLIEYGFLSNEQDRKVLLDIAAREAIVMATAEGIAAHYQLALKAAAGPAFAVTVDGVPHLVSDSHVEVIMTVDSLLNNTGAKTIVIERSGHE